MDHMVAPKFSLREFLLLFLFRFVVYNRTLLDWRPSKPKRASKGLFVCNINFLFSFRSLLANSL
jgi:hypothetical protein